MIRALPGVVVAGRAFQHHHGLNFECKALYKNPIRKTKNLTVEWGQIQEHESYARSVDSSVCVGNQFENCTWRRHILTDSRISVQREQLQHEYQQKLRCMPYSHKSDKDRRKQEGVVNPTRRSSRRSGVPAPPWTQL